MANQENQNIWNIQFDANRNVIIYNYQDNPHEGSDYELTYKNITELAAKTNMPVETKIGDIKFQITPGMTAEQSQMAYREALENKINKQKHKEEFMRTHKENLGKSRAMTDEIRLGVLVSDTPHQVKIAHNADDVDTNIVSSHFFQEGVEQHPEEFSAVLSNLKKSAKIATLKGKIESQENDNDFSFDNIFTKISIDRLSNEQGTDHKSVERETLQLISAEFYRRYKDDMESFLGKDKADLLNRICQENEGIAFVTISEMKHNRYGDCSYVTVSDYDGRQHDMTLYNELRTAELKEGDKILVTMNTVNDSEFGKLDKKDIYIYSDGKYKHCYQDYFPDKENVKYTEIRDITKAIQQRSQGANVHEGKIER
ncbi:MAG: hypothetical protein IKO06_01280 [Alphaproteobacteria bacterium]|nr:hypothetical protein [Alphaproteobacteria bacterium]